MEIDYLKLLLQYSILPQSKRQISFFEVSGYPHYENVCSNILAFYLHPQREHGLGSLLLVALLKLALKNQVVDNNIRAITVEREYPTLLGGRLDLLIISDNYAIGIENKIYHSLENNLHDYKKTIDACAGDKLTSIRIVLSLKPVVPEIPRDVGFLNITYDQLWYEVRAKLGFHTTSTTQRWTTLLIDFMEITESLAGGSMNLTDTDKFFIEHETIIEKFIKDRESCITRLNDQVYSLKDIIDNSADAKEYSKPYIHASKVLVHDYDALEKGIVAFALSVSPKGWVLELFGRTSLSDTYVKELVSKLPPELNPKSIKGERIVIEQWPVATDLGDIKKVLFTWMTWIVNEGFTKPLHTDA